MQPPPCWTKTCLQTSPEEATGQIPPWGLHLLEEGEDQEQNAGLEGKGPCTLVVGLPAPSTPPVPLFGARPPKRGPFGEGLVATRWQDNFRQGLRCAAEVWADVLARDCMSHLVLM